MSRHHRRRWSAGHAPPAPGAVRQLQVARLDSCRPDFACHWHGTCTGCGETIHLAELEVTPGFGPFRIEELALAVVGDPPRCADCRAATVRGLMTRG